MSMASAVQSLMSSVHTRATDLQSEITAATNSGKKLDQEDFIALQFKVGEYNAMMEMTSSITKGVTDMLKTLAQRTS
jgi:type III secretion protein F